MSAVIDRIRIVPTGAALGADVEGIDPANPSDADIAAVKQALRDHLVVRLRGYSITDAQFTHFARRFGELEASPSYSRSRAEYIPDCPEITIISNVVENGQAIGEHGDGELNWHSDKGFVELPSAYTFLLGREVPDSGGDTSFANMYNAAGRIQADLRARLDDLKLKHQRSHTAQGTCRPGHPPPGLLRDRHRRPTLKMHKHGSPPPSVHRTITVDWMASSVRAGVRCSDFCFGAANGTDRESDG